MTIHVTNNETILTKTNILKNLMRFATSQGDHKGNATSCLLSISQVSKLQFGFSEFEFFSDDWELA